MSNTQLKQDLEDFGVCCVCKEAPAIAKNIQLCQEHYLKACGGNLKRTLNEGVDTIVGVTGKLLKVATAPAAKLHEKL